jgi:N-methylhydantoinase A
MRYMVGVDVGGTFTDLVLIDEEGGMQVMKVPSTPADPSIAVMSALERAGSALGRGLREFLADVIRICHGTTVSTNTVLTLSGAKVGMLATKGFRDILTIRVGVRENRYDYAVPQPKPLAPRHLTVGIEERIKWNGEVHTPLNVEEVRQAVRRFEEQGVEAVAICFLWSNQNPSHERQAAEICKKEFPEAYLSVSSDILPEMREYRRWSTAVLNAYVGPALSKYIGHLESSLRDVGFGQVLLITQSNGGVISPAIASEQAARTILSGPACGPAAAGYIGKLYGFENLMTVDMGGTSFDVSLIKQGKPWMTRERNVAGVYLLRLPMVDIHTIGAGGGSIAWLDSKGALHVGPQSAGSDPGPVCYGRGGKEPTVTDADLVLGYLNPDYFLGGEIKLHPELATRALKEKVGDPLGMDAAEVARSVYSIINSSMTDGMSVVSVQRGEDPRQYVMVAAGGAGPVHAPRLAKELSIGRILVPRISSVFCALGGVISDLRHDYVRTVAVRTAQADLQRIESLYQEMEEEAHRTLEREGIPREDRYFVRSMDMRYIGQFHEVEVELPGAAITEEEIPKIVERFHERHEALYAYRDVVGTEIINLGLTAFGRVTKPSFKEQPFEGRDASGHLKGKREVFFEERGGFVPTPIYDGDAMVHGNVVEGPAIIEQRVTTIVLPPGYSLEVTKYGDYLVSVPV